MCEKKEEKSQQKDTYIKSAFHNPLFGIQNYTYNTPFKNIWQQKYTQNLQKNGCDFLKKTSG
jgi:hypothetical protein